MVLVNVRLTIKPEVFVVFIVLFLLFFFLMESPEIWRETNNLTNRRLGRGPGPMGPTTNRHLGRGPGPMGP